MRVSSLSSGIAADSPVWSRGAADAPLSGPGGRDQRAAAMVEQLRARLAAAKKCATPARVRLVPSAPAPNLKEGIHQEGERHATSAGKAGAPPEPGPAVSTTPAPALPITEEGIDVKTAPQELCSNCRTNPLRSDNRTGICAPCKKAPRKHRADGVPEKKPGPSRSRVVAPVKAIELPASGVVAAEQQLDVTKLADDALIALTGACRREIAARQERIRIEAEDRAQALSAALEAT